jgi:hypothetical protein
MTRPPGPARRVVKGWPAPSTLLQAYLNRDRSSLRGCKHVTRAIIAVEAEGCAVAFARGLFGHRDLVKIGVCSLV